MYALLLTLLLFPALVRGEDPMSERAIFAGGCFWGVEHYLRQIPGVLDVISGYAGGHVHNPTYEQICAGTTGHLEAVEVRYDPARTNFEILARMFFEIHDPTQADGQGPDLGEQYLSAVFYLSAEQQAITEKLIGLLRAKGYKVVTLVLPASTFWPAEAYHQRYYERTGMQPYCHRRVKRF